MMKKPFKDELGRSRDKKKKSLIRNGQATFDLMGCGERGKLFFIGKTWKTIENLSNVLFVERSLIVKIRPIL